MERSETIGGFGLIQIALSAPVMAVSRRKTDKTIHAATMDGIMTHFGNTKGKTIPAACGKSVAIVKFGEAVALWPPLLKQLKDGATRCQRCYELTGKPGMRKVRRRGGKG